MNFDTTKHYRTRAGDKVTIHDLVERNSLGSLVTFPLKVSIRPDRPRARSRYAILTAEGRASACGDHRDDIVGEWAA